MYEHHRVDVKADADGLYEIVTVGKKVWVYSKNKCIFGKKILKMAFTKKYKGLGDVILAYDLQYQKTPFKVTVKKAASRKFAKDLRNLNELFSVLTSIFDFYKNHFSKQT